jgi:hypothetical protein
MIYDLLFIKMYVLATWKNTLLEIINVSIISILGSEQPNQRWFCGR